MRGDRGHEADGASAASGTRACAAEAEPVLGLPLDRAEAMLPADLLQGGETILLIVKPSPWYILLSILGPLVVLIALTVIAYVLAANATIPGLNRREAIAAGTLVLAARITWQVLEWLSRIYVLTDRRVIRRMGVLRTFTFETSLRNIQHTELIRTIRERLFCLGTVGFATAGTDVFEAFWVMVARPQAVHRRLVQAINRYGPHAP